MVFSMVFYWWNDSSDLAKVSDDLDNPVVPCISLIRGLNFQGNIYVIDVSSQEKNWENYPYELNFEVIKKSPYLSHPNKLLSKIFDSHMLSKRLSDKYIMLSDTDIFWQFSPSMPTTPLDSILCREDNTGIICFDSKSPKVDAFFDLWKTYINAGSIFSSVKNDVMEKYKLHTTFQEEAVFAYLRDFTLFQEVVKSLPEEYNSIDYMFGRDHENYHCVRYKFDNRGLFPLIFHPFCDHVKMINEIYKEHIALKGIHRTKIGDNLEEIFKSFQHQFSKTKEKHDGRQMLFQ
jgi:hypothetical protein